MSTEERIKMLHLIDKVLRGKDALTPQELRNAQIACNELIIEQLRVRAVELKHPNATEN